jgi:glycosyltransferase involved in cell wall biosynthesis
VTQEPPSVDKKDITVVIPCRAESTAEVTLASLAVQTYRNFKIIIVKDKNNVGPAWARNCGFKRVNTPFVLFSDDDIMWEADALENLRQGLLDNPEAGYSYGWYSMSNMVWCNKPFRPSELTRDNFISTMSMIRSELFPGFDENIKRLQDWDLWLTMLLQHGYTGHYINRKIFSTEPCEDGISNWYNSLSYHEAKKIICEKHGLVLR